MDLDDPFPIERCSERVRGAILAEFKGRCPTIREVADIPDAQWLAVPNIGPTTLEQLRTITLLTPNGDKRPPPTAMTDNELLSRLKRLQRDLALIAEEIRSRLAMISYKKET